MIVSHEVFDAFDVRELGVDDEYGPRDVQRHEVTEPQPQVLLAGIRDGRADLFVACAVGKGFTQNGLKSGRLSGRSARSFGDAGGHRKCWDA